MYSDIDISRTPFRAFVQDVLLPRCDCQSKKPHLILLPCYSRILDSRHFAQLKALSWTLLKTTLNNILITTRNLSYSPLLTRLLQVKKEDRSTSKRTKTYRFLWILPKIICTNPLHSWNAEPLDALDHKFSSCWLRCLSDEAEVNFQDCRGQGCWD